MIKNEDVYSERIRLKLNAKKNFSNLAILMKYFFFYRETSSVKRNNIFLEVSIHTEREFVFTIGGILSTMECNVWLFEICAIVFLLQMSVEF